MLDILNISNNIISIKQLPQMFGSIMQKKKKKIHLTDLHSHTDQSELVHTCTTRLKYRFILVASLIIIVHPIGFAALTHMIINCIYSFNLPRLYGHFELHLMLNRFFCFCTPIKLKDDICIVTVQGFTVA